MSTRAAVVSALLVAPRVAFAQAAPATPAPWDEAAVSAAVTREGAQGHSPHPVAPSVADYLDDAPERVALTLESAGRPQRVVVERRLVAGVTWSNGTPRGVLGVGTCTTPCVMHLPPGPVLLRAEGAGLRRLDTSLDVPARGAHVRLRAPSQALWNLGVGLTGFGASVFAALAGLAIGTQLTGGEGIPTTGALLAAGVGTALLAGGIPLMVLHGSGYDVGPPR